MDVNIAVCVVMNIYGEAVLGRIQIKSNRSVRYVL